MAYHEWGEEGVDWIGIGNAAIFIGAFCSRWGRIRVSDMKEKYGTVRVYCSFGWWDLYSVIRPLYHWVGNEWYWKLANSIRLDWLNQIVVPYQRWIYRMAYKKAIAKWPHLKQEIIDGADYEELLEGL